MTCARKHGIIDALAAARDHLIGLADLGYEGAADILRIPIKKIKGRLADRGPENRPAPGQPGPNRRCGKLSKPTTRKS
jgi:hypothetical protein